MGERGDAGRATHDAHRPVEPGGDEDARDRDRDGIRIASGVEQHRDLGVGDRACDNVRQEPDFVLEPIQVHAASR